MRAGVWLLGAALCGFCTPARAQAAAGSLWSLQEDNSSIGVGTTTDRYYTNGLRLGWTSPDGDVPSAMAAIGHNIWGDGRQRISLFVAQSIFTPADTSVAPPHPDDRPYAGVLMANASLSQDTGNTRTLLGLGLGIIGPPAGAADVQDQFHRVIGQGFNRGWKDQIATEPLAEIYAARIWRVPAGHLGPFELDMLPAVSAGVGNQRIYAQVGSQFRVGQGLDADFGVPQIMPAFGGGTAFAAVRPTGWYLFAGADGDAVAYDVTLNGNAFQSSPRVNLDPLVGQMEVGLAVMLGNSARVSYTQVFQTQEFQGQRAGLFDYGSLAVSVRF